MTDQGEAKRDVVRVGCRQPNGIMLQLRREVPSDMPGLKQQINDGPGVRLNGPFSHIEAGAYNPTGFTKGVEVNDFGTTEVDDEFWVKWVTQNEGRNPLLDGGTVFLLDDEGKPAQNPT